VCMTVAAVAVGLGVSVDAVALAVALNMAMDVDTGVTSCTGSTVGTVARYAVRTLHVLRIARHEPVRSSRARRYGRSEELPA